MNFFPLGLFSILFFPFSLFSSLCLRVIPVIPGPALALDRLFLPPSTRLSKAEGVADPDSGPFPAPELPLACGAFRHLIHGRKKSCPREKEPAAHCPEPGAGSPGLPLHKGSRVGQHGTRRHLPHTFFSLLSPLHPPPPPLDSLDRFLW